MYIRRVNKCKCGETKKFRQVNPREKLGVRRGTGKKLVGTGNVDKSRSWKDLHSLFTIG